MPHGSAQLLGAGWKSSCKLPGSQCEVGKQPDLKMIFKCFCPVPWKHPGQFWRSQDLSLVLFG